MAGPKVRLKQIIRAIGPLGYGDTASATGIRRTALAAALQYRCLAAVLQEPVCWRTRWVRTGVLGAETGSPASRLLQFRVVSGLVGLASAGKATVSYRGIERVSRRACIGGTGFSRERPVSYRGIERVITGLFPAEAGPTVECISSGRAGFSLGWTQSVPGCIPTQSVGTIRCLAAVL
jgi:hypothetical protein